jgi:hypothetical protein
MKQFMIKIKIYFTVIIFIIKIDIFNNEEI